MIVREICDEKEFEALRSKWNELLDRSSFPTAFLTWEWAHTWWKHFSEGKRLKILAVYDSKSHLVGIAPLYIVRKRIGLLYLSILEFIGYGENKNSEYLDFLMDRDRGREVLEELGRHLLRGRNGWDLLNLTNIREDSLTLKVYRRIFEESRCVLDENMPCPYIELPETMDEILLSFKPKKRGNLRNEKNRLNKKHSVKILRENEIKSVSGGIDLLFDLHFKRFGGKSVFYSEENRGFLKEVADILVPKEMLRLYVMKIDGEYASASLCLVYGRYILSYQTGYDPKWLKQNAAKVLLYDIIEQNINEKNEQFDFGRGDEEYKLHWTKKVRRTKDLMVFRRKVTGITFFFQREMYRFTKRMYEKIEKIF